MSANVGCVWRLRRSRLVVAVSRRWRRRRVILGPPFARACRSWPGVARRPLGWRRPGAGRKPVVEVDPGFSDALDCMVDPDTRGDPESPLRWTCKSTRALARVLSAEGHRASSWTVGQELHRLGYSLQANAKTREGKQNPDRDAQFVYINDQVGRFLRSGDPVISVDTKKKEIVGPYKNNGAEWRPAADPEPVKVHDFIDPKLGKANPYGVYDVAADQGWVSVGTDHDTSAFAVNTIRSWWQATGRDHDHHRPESPRRTRPRQLPQRHQDPRHPDEDTRDQRHAHPPRLARRMELHPPPHKCAC